MLTIKNAIALLPALPWLHICIGALIAYAFGWLWYGVLFQKQYMPLIQDKSEDTNWKAMGLQFLGLLFLAYLIGIFSLFPEILLLATDALMGTVLFITLAATLFNRGNTREAIRFWLITTGYELIAITIIFLIIGSKYFF